jgi:hypothetical protein
METTITSKQHILNSLGKVLFGGPRSLFMNYPAWSSRNVLHHGIKAKENSETFDPYPTTANELKLRPLLPIIE